MTYRKINLQNYLYLLRHTFSLLYEANKTQIHFQGNKLKNESFFQSLKTHNLSQRNHHIFSFHFFSFNPELFILMYLENNY